MKGGAMFKTQKVRRRSMTGLGKSTRKLNGLIYLPDNMIGERVYVLKESDYREFVSTVKSFKLKD